MIYAIILFIIILDQVSKALVLLDLPFHQAVSVCPFFNLFFTMNKGVSFSFLATDSPLMPWLLSGFAIGVCGVLAYWMACEKDKVTRIGLALVFGGAVGNVIDRIRLGAVVDFLDFYIGAYHWPAFNIADSAICIGVALIILKSFQKKEKKKCP